MVGAMKEMTVSINGALENLNSPKREQRREKAHETGAQGPILDTIGQFADKHPAPVDSSGSQGRFDLERNVGNSQLNVHVDTFRPRMGSPPRQGRGGNFRSNSNFRNSNSRHDYESENRTLNGPNDYEFENRNSNSRHGYGQGYEPDNRNRSAMNGRGRGHGRPYHSSTNSRDNHEHYQMDSAPSYHGTTPRNRDNDDSDSDQDISERNRGRNKKRRREKVRRRQDPSSSDSDSNSDRESDVGSRSSVSFGGRRYTRSTHARLPPFTGQEPWRVYYNRFKDVAELEGWNDADKLKELLPRLQGRAGEFVYGQLHRDVRSNFRKLVGELKNRFRKVETSRTFGAQFSNRNQLPAESIEEYAAELKLMQIVIVKRVEKICCDAS